MSYCTQDDILERISEAELIQLTDDENTGSADADTITRAIADADEEIDSYVGVRHIVPLDPVPALARKLSAEMAIYNLFGRRQAGPPEHIEKRYNAAVRLLELIAKGQASLGAQDPEGTPPTADAPQMASTNPARVFTRDKLRGF